MRCPDCNKFVSYGEAEIQSVEDQGELKGGRIAIEAEITIPCGECGTALKEGRVEGELKTALPAWCTCETAEKWEWVDGPEGKPFERAVISVGKKGRPLKKHINEYGATITGKIHCEGCQQSVDVSFETDTLSAAAMGDA